MHLCVLRKDISIFCKRGNHDPMFHASAGWDACFMNPWGFVIRQNASVGQHLPQDLEEMVANSKIVKKCNRSDITYHNTV